MQKSDLRICSLLCVALAWPGMGEAGRENKQSANMLELTRLGDSSVPPLVFPGFGPASLVAASNTLPEPPSGSWSSSGSCLSTVIAGYKAEIQKTHPQWDAVRKVISQPKPGDNVSISRLMWSGVSAWMADIVPQSNAEHQRHLIAPLEEGFLVLSFRGPAADFEAARPLLREFVKKIRFRFNGLIAEYYTSGALQWLGCLQVDPTIDFDWGADGAPANGVGPDFFSIRWTGKVVPRFSETYTFSTLSDDGVRLWINGELLIDNWTVHPVTLDSGSIYLEAGKEADLKMEWFENQIHAVARLFWKSESQTNEPVPQECLFSLPAPGLKPPPEFGGGRVEAPPGWPPLMYADLPGGYTVGRSEETSWQGKPPLQTLTFGKSKSTVLARLEKVRVAPANVLSLLPPFSPKDKIDVQRVAWRYAAHQDISKMASDDAPRVLEAYASTWSVECALDRASHPDIQTLYRQYYLVPLKKGLLVLSFESQDKDWYENNIDDFRRVFESVTLTVEETPEQTPAQEEELF